MVRLLIEMTKLSTQRWKERVINLCPRSPIIRQDSGAKPTDSIYLHEVLSASNSFLIPRRGSSSTTIIPAILASLLATLYAGARCVVESSSTLQHLFTRSSRERTTFPQQIRTHRRPPWSTLPSKRFGRSWTSQVSRYEIAVCDQITDNVLANIRNMVHIH